MNNNMRPRKPMNRNFQGQGGGGGRGQMQRRPFRQGGGNGPQGGGYDKQARMRASQNREKFLAKARDALAQGDRVEAENWFQHAEHYFRVLVSLTPPQELAQQQQQEGGMEQGGQEGALDAQPYDDGGQQQQPQDYDAPQQQQPQPPRTAPDSPVTEHGGYDRPVFDRPGYQPRQPRRRYQNQDGQAPQDGQPQPRQERSAPRQPNRFDPGQNLPPFLAEDPLRPERKPVEPPVAVPPAAAPREDGESS